MIDDSSILETLEDILLAQLKPDMALTTELDKTSKHKGHRSLRGPSGVD